VYFKKIHNLYKITFL